MLAETIFQKFFGPDYEIRSQNGYDKVTGRGCVVLHGEGTLIAKRQGENYGERYILNLKGKEIDVLRDWIEDGFILEQLNK
jgi:hypothetical protein